MGLNTGNIGNSNNGLKLLDGVFAQPFKILDVKVAYKALHFDNIRDIVLSLEIDTGKEEHWELILAGDYKRDEATSEVKGWGSVFPIAKLLSTCGIKAETDDQGKFNPDDLRKLWGHELYRVSYAAGLKDDGKVKYKGWNTYFPAGTEVEKMKEEFIASLAKGYPKDYDPESLKKAEDSNSQFNYGANAPAEPAAANTDNDW